MDPIAFFAAAFQAGVALAIVFVVPGVALGPMVAPGASTPLARIGRAVGVSLLTMSLGCTVLARLGILQAPVVFAAVAVSVIVGWAWRRRPATALGAGTSGWHRPTRRALRWWFGAAAGSVLAAGLVVIPSRDTVGSTLLPFTSTVWYYANLAQVVAARGGLPATLSEWGAPRAFQTDYLPVTAHTAAALQLLPGDILGQMETYRVAILVVGLVLGVLLFRRWMSSWLALLGSIALFATTRLEAKYLSYKPETVALDMAIFGLWLVDRAVTERSRRLGAAAVVAGAVVFLAHAEVFLVYAAAASGIVIGRGLVSRTRAGERRWIGLHVDRRAVVTIALGGSMVLGGAVGGVIGNGLLTGSFRILDYATPTGARGPAASVASTYDPNEVPPGWSFTSDPTWDFLVAAVSPASLGQAPPRSFFDSRLLPRAILIVWPGLDGRQTVFLLVIAALIGLAVPAWPFLDARRRRAIVGWAAFGLILFVGSYVLFAVSKTYVPQRTGPRRLMPYELFVPVGSAVLALWIVDRLAVRAWRALVPRAAMLAAGTALAILTVGIVSPGTTNGPAEDPDPGISTAGYDAYRWIDANLPPDARILANVYTDGALTAVSHRVGIVDGRAVYLEDPAFLHESTALVLGARVVFADPDGPGAAKYLAREEVGYLLVIGPTGTGNDIGGYTPFETDLDTLEASPRYTLVRTFGEGRLLLFQTASAG